MDFTPEEIRNLRKRLGMNQSEFGQELFLHDEHTAQVKISKLERGIIRPSAAVKRSLLRLAARIENESSDSRQAESVEPSNQA